METTEDETERLSNLCVDLVSLKQLEPGLLHLFRTKGCGEWASVSELYRIAGTSGEEIKPELAVTWLTSPSGQSGDAIVFFCDEELQWQTTAFYNTARLFRTESQPVLPAARTAPATGS
jgi:hypothetical protein